MIQLSTTLYEKNFRKVLNEDNFFLKIKSDLISKRVYIVNNIKDTSREEFNKLKLRVEEKAEFVESSDIWDQSLTKYKSEMKIQDISWWYSIQYFCQMYTAIKCGIEFVFNIGQDCPTDSTNLDDFFYDSVQLIKEDEKILLTTIPWAPGDFSETGNGEQDYLNRINKRHDKFWMSKVVSDQVFLCSASKCLGVDFNLRKYLHPFPSHGGYSFENSFTDFLIDQDFYRAIHKGNHYYTHNSF